MRLIDWLLVRGWLELGRQQQGCLVSGMEIVGWIGIAVVLMHLVWGGR